MTKSPASIVQELFVDTIKMNTLEGWARFGERVVAELSRMDLQMTVGHVVGSWNEREPELDARDPIDELAELCLKKSVSKWEEVLIESAVGRHATMILKRAGVAVARISFDDCSVQQVVSSCNFSAIASYSDLELADAHLVSMSALVREGVDPADAWDASRDFGFPHV
jgi:hypothetical protein